jgi:hypothetical protein
MLIINELWVKVFFRLSGINATAGTLPRLSDHVCFKIGSKQGTGTGTGKKGRPGSGEGPGPGTGPGSWAGIMPVLWAGMEKPKKLPGPIE